MAHSSADSPRSGFWPEGDPIAYEKACLDQVRLALSDFPHREQHVGDIRLVGRYPETRLTVDLKAEGETVTFEWGLWGDDFGTVGKAGRASPELVGDDVMIQANEFCFAR